MQGETRERWMRLCELASTEQDPKKLFDLIVEINRLLDEKQSLLRGGRTAGQVSKQPSGPTE